MARKLVASALPLELLVRSVEGRTNASRARAALLHSSQYHTQFSAMASGSSTAATLQLTGAIRCSLLPVGSIDAATFRRLSALFRRQSLVDLYTNTHGAARGFLRLHFVDESVTNARSVEWQSLHAHLRVRAAVGICHCPREADLRAAYREFVARQQAEGVTQTLVVAFEPELTADGGLPDCDERMILLPPCDESTAAEHVERLVGDLASALLRGLRAEAEAAAAACAAWTAAAMAHPSSSPAPQATTPLDAADAVAALGSGSILGSGGRRNSLGSGG